mmetsp:Transcript_29431/g.49685  ORF Transcript_29431/g.49685 Transcript_29431/m.49685 type:complete len:109 (+) Transcript_29431:126-452(+)
MTGSIASLFLLIVLLGLHIVDSKKQTPEAAGDRIKRMHQEHNAKKQQEWNNEFLKSNNVKNSRNQQARLKTHNKNLKKEKRRQEAKVGKESMLKGFGEKFRRDRGSEL